MKLYEIVDLFIGKEIEVYENTGEKPLFIACIANPSQVISYPKVILDDGVLNAEVDGIFAEMDSICVVINPFQSEG